MNPRTRMILAIAGAIVVVLLAFFLLISPRRTELADVKAQVQQEQDLTQTLEADLQRLQELQAQEPQLRADLERIRQLVPEEYEIPNFLFQVNTAANQSGVDFLRITPELPKTPPEGVALAEIRVTLDGSGGYFAVQDFIRRLYALDRALRIDLLSLSSADGAAGEISLSATARIFFESDGAAAIGGAVPATPVTPTAVPVPAPTDPAVAPTAGATP